MPTQTNRLPCEGKRLDADDERLVERARAGDETAFAALVCRYRSKLYPIAASVFDDESDAQDVFQNALIKIHDKLETLRDPSSFYSWAYRVVKNTALMEVRKRGRRSEVGFSDLGPGRDGEEHFEGLEPDWRTRGDEAAQNDELRRRLLDAIDDLDAKYQTPFVLYEFEGHDVAEIADLLDLSDAGVKTRLHRARERLKPTLQRYLDEELVDGV